MAHQEDSGPTALLRWRMSEGTSQAVAAERLGVSQGLYSGWESGKKTPGILNLGKIRAITGISLEAWLPPELRVPPESDAPLLPRPRTRRPTHRPPAAA